MKKSLKLILLFSVLFIIALGFGYRERLKMAYESILFNKKIASIGWAITRAVLLDTIDYNDKKSEMRKELKKLYNDTRNVRTFCKIRDDNQLYAVMPDKSISKAEFLNCIIVSTLKINSEIENLFSKLLEFIPPFGWYIGFYMRDVYDTVLYIPENLFNNETLRITIVDAISNPCRYLAKENLYDDYFKTKARDYLETFDINNWNSLACGDDKEQSFDVKLRIFQDNQYYRYHEDNLMKLFSHIDQIDYKEITFKSTNTGE